MPDFKLAGPAEVLHDKATSGLKQSPTIKDWKQLLLDLIPQSSEVHDNQTDFVFLVDALDECSTNEDAAQFLELMGEITKCRSNVQFLCSSRQHVPVKRYFPPETLYTVDVVSDKTAQEMEAFIDGEINNRRNVFAGKLNSLFC